MENPINKYEQEVLIYYCINRELIRPKTNIITAIKYLFALEFITLIITICTSKLLVFVDYSYNFTFLHFFFSIILIMIFSKRFSILLIELYQHYASDEQRRKCSLIPSCSEYAVIALNKYGIIKALRKIYIRLFITCNGTYSLDFP